VSVPTDPVLVAMLAGVVGGITVVVVCMLRFGRDAAAAPVEHVPQARPDRRAQRLDDAVAKSPALRRAVAMTTNLANRRGALGAVERRLRAADVPVRPAELILAQTCAVVFVPCALFLLTRSPVMAVLGLLVVGAGPLYALKFLAGRRKKRFTAQLPDALTALAGSLRAGRSVGQAMEALSRDLPDPIGRELRKVVAESRLGRPLTEALSDAADRVDSPDFRWVVLAMQIQSEVGGNLAELLDQVSATMRGRAQMRGEVKALTAEGRASAMMLVVLVPALAGVMAAINRDYMAPLVTTMPGRVMVGISAVMIGGGYAWMNSMVKIDV
jgi:tight adherence protein B